MDCKSHVLQVCLTLKLFVSFFSYTFLLRRHFYTLSHGRVLTCSFRAVSQMAGLLDGETRFCQHPWAAMRCINSVGVVRDVPRSHCDRPNRA